MTSSLINSLSDKVHCYRMIKNHYTIVFNFVNICWIRGNNVVLLPIGFPKIVKEYSFASFALIAIYYLTKKDVINEIKSM